MNDDSIRSTLNEAREAFLMGVRLSKQGSYARKLPDPESIPHFTHARNLLLRLIASDMKNTDALFLISQIEECFLNYSSSIKYLEQAFIYGEPKTNKNLKRLASLRQHLVEWRDLSLSPEQLKQLGKYLISIGVDSSCTDLVHTKEWLRDNGIDNSDAVISALKRRGAFSDFQVLENISS